MSSEVKVTVVCSTQDRASQNIKNNLLALRKWEQKSSELYTVFEFKNYRLVEIKDPLIYQDGLDRRMLESGFPARLLIFASKHRSKDARAILTVHSTGNMDGVPWQFCRQLRQKVKEVCPTGRARITNGIKCECQNCICPRVKIARLSPALLSEAEKIEKKFSTERATALGIIEGPLYGRLARGESVMLDGKTINPEMVYEINIRAIKLNYEKAIEE